MYSFKKNIILYFNLSKKEFNGFVVICLLMFVCIFSPLIYRRYFLPKKSFSIADKIKMDSLVTILQQNVQEESIEHNVKKTSAKKSFSFFDPSSDSEEKLIKAGLPEFLAKRIEKFRSKGGRFKNKEDLKKIYGLSETLYKQLTPFIVISEIKAREEKKTYSTKPMAPKQVGLVNLNVADSIQLIAIRGIGPVFAARIIKYRKKLGGYRSIQQLREVYGIDSAAFEKISSQLEVSDAFICEKIALNEVSLYLLSSHPYSSKKLASIVIAYRNQHGRFSSIDELSRLHGLQPEAIIKLRPYLTLD